MKTTRRKKKRQTDAELDMLIAMSIWNAQLDALGCPEAETLGMRLSLWLLEKGIEDPFNTHDKTTIPKP